MNRRDLKMSEDWYATPDVTGNVRGEGGERREKTVDIYDSLDNLGEFDPSSQIQQEMTRGLNGTGTQETKGPNPGIPLGNIVLVTKNPSRAVAVCLGLLCVLLLAAITVLVVLYIKVPNSWGEERHLLQTTNNNLTKERDNLQKMLSVLKEVACGPECYQIGSSLYYISTEMKTWNQSRQDCLCRGADLVVINSQQEQNNLTKQFNKRAWIGLTDIDVEGTWKWVDGTPLNTSFWHPGQPDNGGTPGKEEDCAEIYQKDPPGLWNDFPCGNMNYWICEIKI